MTLNLKRIFPPAVPDPTWPELNVGGKEGDGELVRLENLEALRALTQETLKNQVEGGRLVVARCYTTLGYAINIALVAIGGVGLASGAVTKSDGWFVHPSIAWSLVVTAASSLGACALAVWGTFPVTLLGVAAYPIDFYDQDLLAGGEREFKIALIRHFAEGIRRNSIFLPSMRRRLFLALILMASAPFLGVLAYSIIRWLRLTSS